jgi:LacI family transcriptional regulator
MPQETKHRQIFCALAAEIGAGKYRETGRLPSESQLVIRFRASRPTVVRALRDLQAEGLVTRRAGAGTFQAQAGHAPPPGASRELGLLIPGLGRMEIFEVIAGELARLARAAGYLFWWTGNADPRWDADASLRDAEEFCAHVVQRKVAGVFFAPFERTDRRYAANLSLVNKLHEAGCAVVLLDRDLGPFPTRSDLDLVGIDNFLAGYILAEHLIKLGSQRIAFVAYPHCAHTMEARVAGAREAILGHRMEVRAPFFWKGNTDDPKFVRQLSAGRLLDAVICGNDYTAAQLIRTLTKLGVHVPRDLRVVGLDDVHYATVVSPALTTIHQPCRDIAAIAFDAMLTRISDPDKPSRTLLLTPHVVVRESCGAYLSNPRQGGWK